MSDNEKREIAENPTSRPRITRPSYLRGPVVPRRPSQPAIRGEEPGEKENPPAQTLEKREMPQDEDKELYRWNIWLFPRRPLVSALVVGSLIVSILLAYWAFPQVLFVAVAALMLLNRLAPYLFPMECILTEKTAGYKAFLAKDIRPWNNLVTYYEFPDGVLLSHDDRSIRGRLREGLFLYYYPDKSNKDEILSIVQSKLKPPKEAFKDREEKDKEHKGGIGSAIRRVRRLKGE